MRKKPINMTTTMSMTMIVVASLIRTMKILAAARENALNKTKKKSLSKVIGSYFLI
ncbi:hypothetical protein [Peptoniphilus hominis (ex Hitch et al. 2025)]|uniref:Uncharacterized protein n=1 Tax=Peptoniphilus hominis (ex Hitch et al. 2025) TaxID=3133174 RepID=A0ABV1CAZ7_9FIRM